MYIYMHMFRNIVSYEVSYISEGRRNSISSMWECYVCLRS